MACISKRRDRWIIDFYDNQGKRRWETLPKGTTKGKAREALRKIEDQLEKGNYIPNKKVPTFSDVAEDWLEHKKPNLRQSTWSVYEGHVKNHFHDLDSIKMNRLTTARIEKFIGEKQKADMNISTLRKILVTLGQIVAYASRHNYMPTNTFRDAEKPKGKGGVVKSKIRILTPEEIKGFIDAEKNPKYKTLFMLAITSGARQGELLGFKWSDVDWENNQIHVQRTFNNQAWYDVKTKTSNRKIDLGRVMMTELKKWKLLCPPNDLDLIFPNKAGQPINHNNLVSRNFLPALKAAEIDTIRFHDLRHTYASLLIEQGENIKYIQSQLGHSAPTVTLNVYAHLMKPTNQESALRLENTIFQNNGSKMVANSKKRITQ